jgi:hypothetical protein
MNRRTLLVSFALLSAALVAAQAAPPGALELFSADEAVAWNTPGSARKEIFQQRELREPGVPSCHDLRSAAASAHEPQIEIVAPALDKTLAAPVDIDLKFLPADNAAIRPETFKVCYVGFLVMDITKRITDHVTVSAEGLHVAGAQLPSGHHHLVMMIADQQGAIGRRDAVFDIK